MERTFSFEARAVVPTMLGRILDVLEARGEKLPCLLHLAYGAGRTITLSGDLTGTPRPAGQTVMIFGKAGGTTVTDAKGHYTITRQASGCRRRNNLRTSSCKQPGRT